MVRVSKKVLKNKSKKEFTQCINAFLNSVNRQPPANEKMFYNDGINTTFQGNAENKVVENSLLRHCMLNIHTFTN
jgi:hypothetical protein